MTDRVARLMDNLDRDVEEAAKRAVQQSAGRAPQRDEPSPRQGVVSANPNKAWLLHSIVNAKFVLTDLERQQKEVHAAFEMIKQKTRDHMAAIEQFELAVHRIMHTQEY